MSGNGGSDPVWFFWGYDCALIFTFKEAGIVLQTVSELTSVTNLLMENAKQGCYSFDQ